MSKQDTANVLMQEEIEDIWYLLEVCYQAKETKGMTVCLELLDSSYHCPETLLKQTTKSKNIELINKIIEEPEYTSEINLTLAKKVLLKLEGAKIKGVTAKEPILESEVALTKTFDQPPSLRVCLFQLSESNDLERVTFLLQTITRFPKDEFDKLKKSGITQKVIKVLQKYCNGDYEFDQEITKLGSFQYCLIQSLISLSGSFKDFDELLEGDVFGMLGQIVEEGLIYIYDKSVNSWMEWNNKLPSFVDQALRFFELGVHIDCVKYYDSMNKVYIALIDRIKGLTPQEVNINKIYKTLFYNKSIDIIESIDEPQKNLKAISPSLYNAFKKLKELIVKLDAMKEYAETHKEKYDKLFGALIKKEVFDFTENKENSFTNFK